MFNIKNVKPRTILIVSFFVLTVVGIGIFLLLKSTTKKSSVGTTPLLTTQPTQQPTTKPTTQPTTQPTTKPTTQSTIFVQSPAQAQVVDIFAKPPEQVVDAAVLVRVLPDTIKVTIESDDPKLKNFSDAYYYSFSSVVEGDDPKVSSWSWTLDDRQAPGGIGYRGKIRAQLNYNNKYGEWDLNIKKENPSYPEPPFLLRATTGPLDKWNSVWGATWTIEALGTTEFAMPIIKLSAIGTGVIARWT